MTRLTGITPTPAQLRTAYVAEFKDALAQAGGKDGRISRASAEKLAKSGDAGKLVADNILNFLDATGQKTVGAEKLTEVVGDYVQRHAEAAAGNNQRLSLREIRMMPMDLQDDILHLRGKDDLAAPPPVLRFNENDIYAFEPWNWQPQTSVSSGSLKKMGAQVIMVGLPKVEDELKSVVKEALNDVWAAALVHRANGNQPVQLGDKL
ncbi:MAG: hypothetical protein GY822_19490 [Deltaproteobacteria bacterium]|nr:hypothetical protein [Deltaproteobacteria bacterium]